MENCAAILKFIPKNIICQGDIYRINMKENELTFTASVQDEKKRLDMFVKENLKDVSRSHLQKWIKDGFVLCNGNIAVSAHKLKTGDVVTISGDEKESQVIPEDISLEILYEDSSLLVVNKPAGMVTHPAKGNITGTLVNAAAFHIKGKKNQGLPQRKIETGYDHENNLRPGVVHRLDKDTSGVIVIAKNAKALENLSNQFKDRNAEKVYRTIVRGRVSAKKGEVEGPIGKGYRTRKMLVTPNGRFSKTDFKVLKVFPRHTYLEVYPKTGRTHQIRVHLTQIGYPIFGDTVYGAVLEPETPARQMLHAYKLTIRHPVTKKKMTFTAPLPKDFEDTLKKLG